jgi:hypothetical protein
VLHVLRARLFGGQLAEASRGELEMRLPVGLVNDASGPEFGATFVPGTFRKPLTWASCG